MVPRPASSSGIATSPHSSSGSGSPPSVATVGSQSSISESRTISRLRSSADSSSRQKPGSTKSRTGRADVTTSRTTEPCWRAVTSEASYSALDVDLHRRRVGDVDDEQAGAVAARVGDVGLLAAISASRPITTTSSPTSRISASETSGRSSVSTSTGSSPVSVYAVSTSSSIRTSSSPSVLTTSGSSTPSSCTLVPVPLLPARGRLRHRGGGGVAGGAARRRSRRRLRWRSRRRRSPSPTA